MRDKSTCNARFEPIRCDNRLLGLKGDIMWGWSCVMHSQEVTGSILATYITFTIKLCSRLVGAEVS